LADVQATAKKFIRPDNAHIMIVGKGSDIADKLTKFGEIKYFDIYGESYVPAASSELPAGLTAEKVIANFIQAIGGEKKIQDFKSLKITMKATVQGNELIMSSSKKAPGKSLTEVSFGGNVMQKSVTDGKEIAQTSMGQKAPVDPASKEKELFDAHLVPETMLSKLNVKTTLKAIENVDGKEAYVVEYEFPAGSKVTNYFDKETGLKVQAIETVKGPQGEIAVPAKFQDYKEVKGIKFPHTLLISQGPMNFKFEISGIEINPTLDDSLVKVE
jgi:hypothetical protein